MVSEGPRQWFRPALVLFLLLAMFSGSAAWSASRTALVIGNANYREKPLRNPVNDARDIAKTLRELDFEVIERKNLSARAMADAVSEFAAKLQQSRGVGLFYYSGHGVQVNGQNYLIPVDATIRSAADVKYEALNAGRVLSNMELAGARLSIVILDACRDNPFKGWYRGSDAQGLAQMNAPTGSIIAYSTAPGKVAADGTGRNSPFTQHLLAAMRTPGWGIERVLKKVRIGVMNATGKRQVPWESSSLTGDFYFVAPAAGVVPPASPGMTVGTAFQDRLKDGGRGPEMVVIPAGEFWMGSPESEDGRDDDERRHRVSVKTFAIGKYEVTNGEYRRFKRSHNSGGSFNDDRQPVIEVNWIDAVAYAEWLSEQTGERYRLPTEAEWEYAARAGTETAYWWGGEIGRNNANCYDCGSRWDGERTAPVGSFRPNSFGLHDTAGNVWEWTCSKYEANYSGAERQCLSKNDANGARRVLRGGSWDALCATCARPTASGTRQPTATSASGSAWPGRYNPFSFMLLPFTGGSRGRSPRSIFSTIGEIHSTSPITSCASGLVGNANG